MADKIIAIDFDGTIVTHMYPAIGAPVPNALRVMKRLQDAGVKLILWTMRDKTELVEAVAYCNENGITFFGVNENPNQKIWTNSPKAYAQIYIDDAALGTPLLFDQTSQRNMVNWKGIENMLELLGVLLPK